MGEAFTLAPNSHTDAGLLPIVYGRSALEEEHGSLQNKALPAAVTQVHRAARNPTRQVGHTDGHVTHGVRDAERTQSFLNVCQHGTRCVCVLDIGGGWI